MCDNFCRGRTKHVWVSTSTDLHADAVRDLRDLGMQLPVINNCAALDAATKAGGLSKDFQEGVLFLTYSTLVSAGRGGTTRFEQVLTWLGGQILMAASSLTSAIGVRLSPHLLLWHVCCAYECYVLFERASGTAGQRISRLGKRPQVQRWRLLSWSCSALCHKHASSTVRPQASLRWATWPILRGWVCGDLAAHSLVRH